MTRAGRVGPGQLFYAKGILWLCVEAYHRGNGRRRRAGGYFLRVEPVTWRGIFPAGAYMEQLPAILQGEVIDMSIPYDGGPS